MPARLPLQEAIPRTLALDCQAAQVFLGDPSYMRFKPLPQKLIMTLQQQARKARLVSLIIHASFAINLASAREQARKSSLSHWKGTLHHAERLRATSVIVHLGRYQGPMRERGIDHFLQGMQQSLTMGEKAPPMVLLENSYGASHALGSSLEELGSIYTRVAFACPHWRIGLCLDTAHLWSAGYDLSTEEATRCVLQEIETHIGLQHIKVIHLNNSSSEKGSGIDKHARWGESASQFPQEVLPIWICDPRLAHVVWMLETPIMLTEAGEEDWQHEQQHIKSVRQIIQQYQSTQTGLG